MKECTKGAWRDVQKVYRGYTEGCIEVYADQYMEGAHKGLGRVCMEGTERGVWRVLKGCAEEYTEGFAEDAQRVHGEVLRGVCTGLQRGMWCGAWRGVCRLHRECVARCRKGLQRVYRWCV